MTVTPNASIVLGGVGLVKGSIRNAGSVMVEICQELNPIMLRDGFLANAPFKLLSGIIRYGTKCDSFPEKPRIDKRHHELQFAVEVNMPELRAFSRTQVKQSFLQVLRPALYSISAEFDLPHQCLDEYFGPLTAASN
jgi:Immunity protein 39